MYIHIKVSKDSILEDFFGTDEQAEQSCENFARQLEEEVKATFEQVQVEVEITETEDRVRVDGAQPNYNLLSTIDNLTDTVYQRFEWVVE